MQKIMVSLLVVGLTSGTLIAEAANIHIKSGTVGGNGSGSDWTNAMTTIPDPLVRGNLYYLAPGTGYGPHTYSQASGTTVIELRRATVADHGAAGGWNNSFDSGQVVFTDKQTICLSHFKMNGVTGGGPTSWQSGHGIAIRGQTIDEWIFTRDCGSVSDVTFDHVEVDGVNGSANGPQTGILMSGSNSYDSWTFRNMFIHEIPCDFVKISGNVTNTVFEYNYWKRNYQDFNGGTCHGDLIEMSGNSSYVWRWSICEDCNGSYYFGAHSGTLNGAEVYGSVFFSTGLGGMGNGLISALSNGGGVISNMKFYNNTLVNNGPGSNHRICVGDFGIGTGNVAQNNIVYESTAGFTCDWGAFTHDYDAFRNVGSQSEAHIQNLSGDPFVSIAGKNFALSAATTAGNTLAAPYNVDYNATTRGADGTWDRGAVEFCAGGCGGGGDTTPPSTVTGLGATGGNLQIVLNWTAATDNVGVALYNLERCSGIACTPSPYLQLSPTTTYTDTGLTASTSYSYRMKAQDAAGNTSTSYSTTVTAVTNPPPPAVTTWSPAGNLRLAP